MSGALGPGDAVHEETVIRWLKEEGEHVDAAEALLEVSSGMTSTEILSPAAGIVRDIATAEDETAPVGAQLAIIEETLPAPQEPSATQIDPEALLAQLSSCRSNQPGLRLAHRTYRP